MFKFLIQLVDDTYITTGICEIRGDGSIQLDMHLLSPETIKSIKLVTSDQINQKLSEL